MSKYYKAEDVHKTILGMWTATFHNTTDTLIGKLESLPAIEVVRCEDCRLATYTVKNRASHEIFYACPYSSIHNEGKSFCSYGERKEKQ